MSIKNYSKQGHICLLTVHNLMLFLKAVESTIVVNLEPVLVSDIRPLFESK